MSPVHVLGTAYWLLGQRHHLNFWTICKGGKHLRFTAGFLRVEIDFLRRVSSRIEKDLHMHGQDKSQLWILTREAICVASQIRPTQRIHLDRYVYSL